MQEAHENQPRAVRSDAVANRHAIIAAARAVFAEHGLEAPLSLVVATAELGRATFYRHFADREELLAALFEDSLRQLHEVKDHTAEAQQLTALLRAAAPLQEASFPISMILHRDSPAHLRQRITADVVELLERPLALAKLHGTVRPDLTVDDVVLLFTMIGGAVVFRPGPGAEHRLDRALHFALEILSGRLQ